MYRLYIDFPCNLFASQVCGGELQHVWWEQRAESGRRQEEEDRHRRHLSALAQRGRERQVPGLLLLSLSALREPHEQTQECHWAGQTWFVFLWGLPTLFSLSHDAWLSVPQAMILSRRSADASQRALAYSRMVDGLNEFRWVCGDMSVNAAQQVFCLFGSTKRPAKSLSDPWPSNPLMWREAHITFTCATRSFLCGISASV